MISLTFGEQVKIVLSRKGMTIKELAEQIEAKTGKKMSRQNLTQRLGRDNFQEQDMRMIADILGCSFQLSILASSEAAEKASVIEEVPPTDRELDKLAAKKEQKAARAEARDQKERDITIGEFVDMMKGPLPEEINVTEEAGAAETAEEQEAVQNGAEAATDGGEETMVSEVQVTEAPEADAEAEVSGQAEVQPAETENLAVQTQDEAAEQKPQEESVKADDEAEEASAAETEEAQTPEAGPEKKTAEKEAPKAKPFTSAARFITPRKEEPKRGTANDFQPIKKRQDEDEDLAVGDVNPYTGHEYQSNSVRMHPKRIGYVQVYDRKEHKWTDMTEWAFLGVEDRKKAMLGKDYEPPIYLD